MGYRRWALGALGVVLLLSPGLGARLAADQGGGPAKPAQKTEEAPLKGGIPFPTEPAPPNENSPQVFVDGKGRVYRLWVREVGEKGRGGEALFNRSEDGGLTWLKEPMVLPDLSDDRGRKGQIITPQLALGPDGQLFALWRTKYRGPNDRLIRFQRSPDWGATWAPESRTINKGNAGFEPQLALGPGGRLYAAWSYESSRRGRAFDIFFARSEDGGKSWPPEVSLTRREDAAGVTLGGMNFRPRLAADASGRVYLTWISVGAQGSTLFFRRSNDFGATWEPPVNVGIGGSSTSSQTLIQDGRGGLLLIWNASHKVVGAPLGVHASRSEDGGKSWTPPVRIDRLPEGRPAQAAFPEVAQGPQGEIYVVWQDSRNGREDIYLNRSLDGGKSWLEEDIRIDRDDPGTAISRRPQIAVSEAGTIAVAWEDDRKGFAGIYLAISRDRGQSWQEQRVDQDTPQGADARTVGLAWGPGEVLHLVWEPQKRLSASDLETSVRYRRLAIEKPSGS